MENMENASGQFKSNVIEMRDSSLNSSESLEAIEARRDAVRKLHPSNLNRIDVASEVLASMVVIETVTPSNVIPFPNR